MNEEAKELRKKTQDWLSAHKLEACPKCGTACEIGEPVPSMGMSLVPVVCKTCAQVRLLSTAVILERKK
jgi:hypothetical protein